MNSRRHDLYTLVHKGQRARLFDLTARAGRLAPEDAAARAALIAELEATLAAIGDHAEAEHEHFGPLYREAAPATGERLARDHERVGAELAALRGVARAALEAEGDGGRDLGLYRALARFTAAYLDHVDAEEGSLPELWSAFDDAALARAQGQLVASHPPATVRFNLQSMLPAASSPERVAFLRGLRRAMPEAAFAGVRALVAGLVSAAEWRSIEADAEPVAAAARVETAAGAASAATDARPEGTAVLRVAEFERAPHFHEDPDAVTTFRAWVASQPGFQAGWHASDASGRVVSVSVWDDLASVVALRERPYPGGPLGARPDRVLVLDRVARIGAAS